MASCVYYRFKSFKEFNMIRFDGAKINCAVLKWRIAEHGRMQKGLDKEFQLTVTHAQTHEGE